MAVNGYSFQNSAEQLSSIYGINTTSSCAIIAEIGTDMSQFKAVNKNNYPTTFVNLKNEVVILKPTPDDSLWTGSYLAALFVVSS